MAFYVPPSVQKECPIYFAVNNCDFQNNTPDGKYEFHDTIQIVCQNSTNPLESKPLKIEWNQNKAVDLNPFPAKEIIPKPLLTVFAFQHAIGKYIENSGLDQSTKYLMESTRKEEWKHTWCST